METHPIQYAGVRGVPLLASEREELLAQIVHVQFLKKKNLQDTVLRIIKEQGTCLSTAYTLAGASPHSTMREILNADQMFQRKVGKALLRHRKSKCKIILNYLRAGGGFEGACKAAGISVNTGGHYRYDDYAFDIECQHLINSQEEGWRVVNG